jgi:hypothetical protein
MEVLAAVEVGAEIVAADVKILLSYPYPFYIIYIH